MSSKIRHQRDVQKSGKDYLWDRSGQPHPEIQRLEHTLASFRHSRATVPAFPENAFNPVPLTWRERLHLHLTTARLAAAALVGLAIASGVWLCLGPRPPLAAPTGWHVQFANSSSQTDFASSASAKMQPLQIGEALETRSDSTATVSAAEIGRLEVEPLTRLRLLQSANGRKHFALDRGTIRATIWAAPGQFVVDTPSAVAVDLGCIYTLHVDDDGSGTLRTTLGWVGFHRDGRDSFIPAGAACSTHPQSGPGTPYFEDASPAFRSALAQFDASTKNTSADPSVLRIVLSEARKRDALTLWHLLSRVDNSDRSLVYARLSQLVPPPSDVTRDAILSLDHTALDAWWNALDLGDISLWRHWERTWMNTNANKTKQPGSR
jgi:hypothetical protein